MAAPRKSSLKLNLLVHQGNQPRVHERLIRWLLSSGRFLIILVELLVITGFVTRFKFDADLADLHDQIKQQIPYIESLKNQEVLIRQTHLRLAAVSKARIESPNWSEILSIIIKLAPVNINLNNVSLDRSQSFPKISLNLTGRSPSNIELAAFVKALQKDPTFADISLNNVSFDQQQIIFNITGSLAQTSRKRVGGN